MKWAVGDERSFSHRFTQEQVSEFARLVGDFNPVHIDPAYTRELNLGEPVVHGMLAASFVSTLVGMHIPGPGALWQSFDVSWRQKIRVGDTIEFTATVVSIHASTNSLDLKIVAKHVDTKDVCFEGKGRVMIIAKEIAEPERVSDITEQRILITGATGQLGGAICREFAKHKARLILLGRNRSTLEQLSSNAELAVIQAHVSDLTNGPQLKELVGQILDEGPVFGFVHAASPPLKYLSVNHPEFKFALKEQWQVNVESFCDISSLISETMPSGGAIVHVSTEAVFDVPPAKLAHYVAAKAAAWAIIKGLAVELGPKGIRCNAVSPSLMDTAYTTDLPQRLKQVAAATNPLRRLCTVEDVARAVVFLCGPQASFINGSNLPVTGGAKMP